MIRSIFIIILLASSSYTKAQTKAFDNMVNGLLKKSVPFIKINEAKVNTTALFLDAREKKEYNISHLKNAQYVGYDMFNINILAKIPKDKEIIVYCSVGKRSEDIGEKLMNAGFKNVKNLYGGIFEWINNDLQIVNNTGKQTNKIHAYSKEWGKWVLKGEKVY